jgi:L-aspartate oxidase
MTNFRDDLDLIVVGSGVAGLSAALHADAAGLKVGIVTKRTIYESNTRYAQGGIAAALDPRDSAERHQDDTVACGAGLNDSDAVSVVTADAADAITELVELGVRFDRSGPALNLAREAAHSRARVVHWGDATGASVVRGMVSAVRRLGIPIAEQTLVIELLVDGQRVTGIEAVHAGQPFRCNADRVLLATGGAGQLFNRTTNPDVATADGVALAYRAGAQLMDLEFYQFHPTALALPGRPAFLISEAARGEGGVLRNADGESFMRGYHPDGDLAPRDIVSRSIWAEMARTDSPNVFLDLTHLDASHLLARFPNICKECRRFGIDTVVEPIPVAPAAHYFMGGIRSDVDGRTSVPGLLAAGEVACTALHGANRLASNSLLEGLVVGRRVATADHRPMSTGELYDIPPFFDGASPVEVDLTTLQQQNWEDIGIIRCAPGLNRAVRGVRVAEAPGAPPGHEEANLALVSRLIGRAALTRTETRGAHCRSDYPETDDDWAVHLVLWQDPTGGPRIAMAPVTDTSRELVAV